MLYLMLTKLKLGLLVNQTFTNSFLKFANVSKRTKQIAEVYEQVTVLFANSPDLWMILNSFARHQQSKLPTDTSTGWILC